MAVKVKKTTAKKTTTKKAPKKVIEEVADSIIENSEKAEVRPEILEEIKKQEPIVETCSEPEYTPTVEEVEETIKGFETMNGDPAVIAPKEEVKVTEIHEEAIKQTFKHINNRKGAIDRSFGYSWNGMEMD